MGLSRFFGQGRSSAFVRQQRGSSSFALANALCAVVAVRRQFCAQASQPRCFQARSDCPALATIAARSLRRPISLIAEGVCSSKPRASLAVPPCCACQARIRHAQFSIGSCCSAAAVASATSLSATAAGSPRPDTADAHPLHLALSAGAFPSAALRQRIGGFCVSCFARTKRPCGTLAEDRLPLYNAIASPVLHQPLERRRRVAPCHRRERARQAHARPSVCLSLSSR